MKVNKLKMQSLLVIPAKAGISLTFLFGLFAFFACTDYVQQIDDQIADLEAKQSGMSSNIEAVVSHEDLPSFCDEEGSTVYVEDEDVDYVCMDGAWHPPISSSSSSAKSSSSEKIELSSSSSGLNQFNPDIEYGELLDSRDGQMYKTVEIGSQTWMAENLNYETDDSYCYDDVTSNSAKYGRLYMWFAAETACPTGWHLPSKSEWEMLLDAVGDRKLAGKKLKSMLGWYDSGNGMDGTDDFGFSAIPAGSVNLGGYHNNHDADFWSSTEYIGSNAYYMHLDNDDDFASLHDGHVSRGFSVRCLQDDGSEQTSQSSSSEISILNSSEESSSSSEDEKSSSSEKVESSSSSLVDLASPCKTESEDNCEYGEFVDDRDGQTYKTVKIGSQTWMAQNLNYEVAISYCISCPEYGRLYTWAAAIGKSESECGYNTGYSYGHVCSLPSGNIQGVCPSGWHLPSKDEWNTLLTVVGDSSTAGIKLKSMSGWFSNDNDTDAFGFSAFPAGYRYYNGTYYPNGTARFWSSTEDGSSFAYAMLLNNDVNVRLDSDLKGNAYSVRCLQDDVSEQTAESSSSEPQISSSSEKIEMSSSSLVDLASPCKTESEDNCEYGELIDNRDGQTYKTVSIGSQTWMAENLNFKTDSSFCYSNNETNCTTYGRLYTWTAAISACPSGWHLPSYDEWNSLFTAVGGASTAGPVLRATSGWYGNGNGSDDFGFSALPAGNYDQGYFNNREDEASFWMADEFNSESASYARLRYWEAYVYLGDHYKHYGLSVRCLKD